MEIPNFLQSSLPKKIKKRAVKPIKAFTARKPINNKKKKIKT
jgi:hypothetical protein